MIDIPGRLARIDAATAVRWSVAAALLAITWWVFAPVTDYGFVGFDDERYVVNDPQVRQGLGAASLRAAFGAPRFSNWHPLTTLSYALDVDLHGLDPGGFHATNLALHLCNVLLVLLLFERSTGALWPAALVAALFAWHPLHVEPVAWISQRKELLAALFGLLATLAWLGWVRRGGGWRYAAVLLCAALSLLSKATWVTLPALLLILDHWPLDRLRRAPLARLVEKLPLLALSLAASAVTLFAQGPALETGSRVAWPDRIANALVSPFTLLGRTVWPADLSVLYPHPALPGGRPLGALEVGLALAGVAGLAALAWRLRDRGWGWLPAGLAWYAVALLPVAGLVQVGEQATADRYTYVPLLGIFWILAFGAREAHRALYGRWPAAAGALIGALLLVLVVLAERSADQRSAWRDTVTLYERSLDAAPNSPTLHFNLGNRLLRRNGKGDEASALSHYEWALRLRPDWEPPSVSLAWLLATSSDPALRDPQRALALAARVVERAPSPNALDTLATAQAASGDTDAAARTARLAVDGARSLGRLHQAQEFEARLETFAAGRPYRRPPPDPSAGSTSKSSVR